MCILVRMFVFNTIVLHRVFMQIAPVENDDSYDELKRDAKTCLSLMSQGLLYPEQIPLVLQVLSEVSLHVDCSYWMSIFNSC